MKTWLFSFGIAMVSGALGVLAFALDAQQTAPAPAVQMDVTQCKVTLTAPAPDASIGWRAQFLRDGVLSVGNRDAEAPFERSTTLAAGPHTFSVRWTKPDGTTLTSALASVACPAVAAPPLPACSLSDWSAWTPGEWSACVGGLQTRTETRTRTVLTGTCSDPLTESRVLTQSCTVLPPPPAPLCSPQAPHTLTASVTAAKTGEPYTVTVCTYGDDVHVVTLDGQGGVMTGSTCDGTAEGPTTTCTKAVTKTAAAPGVVTHTSTAVHRNGSPWPAQTVQVTVTGDPVPPPPPPPPPPDPPPTGTPFACGTTTQDFWTNLLTSGYTLHSYTLRDPRQAQYWPDGLVSRNGPNFWSYDAAEDALRLSIPEFHGANCTLAAALAADATAMQVSTPCGIDPGDHLRIDGEVVRATGLSEDQRTVTIQRAQRTTSAGAHPTATSIFGSSNSGGTDIRLPSPTSGVAFNPPLNKDGDTYLVLWDNKFDESYRVSRSGMISDVYKHVQFWTRSNLSNPGGPSFRWLEHRVGFCDGCGGEQPPDFNPAPGSSHVAYLDFRCDGGGNGPVNWLDQTGGRTLFGPNTTYFAAGSACYDGSTKRHFIVDANRWFRRATEIRTQVNNYDLISSWAKSETRPLTPLLVGMQGSLRFSDGETNDAARMMTILQLEIDTSKQNLDGREVGSVLKQWFRNVWIGRNVPATVRDQILACEVR